MFEDRFKIELDAPKADAKGKGAKAKPVEKLKKGLGGKPEVTVDMVEKSLARATKALGDGRWGVIRTERTKDTVTINYGINGRKLDAAALAYELNN